MMAEQEPSVDGDGVLVTPTRLTTGWEIEALALIKEGRVKTIQCQGIGGDARGALEIAETLQRSTMAIKAVVPAGEQCNSACAMIWFGARHRSAEGGQVVLHVVGNLASGTDEALTHRSAKILSKAGASKELQGKFLRSTWKTPFALTAAEIKEHSKSP
jgi:hypothetical protein